MFDYDKMIRRAVQFFPTWSDIRKRYKTSTGGKLLSSTVEEIADLEQAIAEYKKYYFLDTYIDSEDDVMAYAYGYPIGEIDLETLYVLYDKEYINVTTDITKFMTYDLIAYYESGILYLHDRVNPDLAKFFVYDSEVRLDYSLSHVWNLFDEFACFVGLERHPHEKNSELVKRILYLTAHKPNASIDGLKDAIISELMIDFPEINKDIIKIEQANSENLRQAYKNFNTLLDYLNSINCDVYRWKRWDLNTWQHDFKSISYLPIVWDESISNFMNGVGYGDDCAVSIASNIQKTDSIITLYNKSQETMYKYLADKKLEKNISFSFKKYNDILSSNLINYTIKAAKLTRLYPNQISMHVFQNVDTVFDVPIEGVFSHGHNIATNKTDTQIKDVYPYRLKFEAKDNNQDIQITKCMLHYIDIISGKTVTSINLLKNKTGFKTNAFGTLVSNSIKRSVTKVEDFDNKQYLYLKNLEGTTGMQMTGTSGYGVKTLYNLGGQSVSYSASCEPSPITKDMNLIELKSSYGVWDYNNINFYPDGNAKKITIKITANQFSFDVLSNNTVNVMVRYKTDGNYNVIEKASKSTTWSTKVFDAPRYMEIVISTNASEAVRIGNFKYAHYSVVLKYKTGNEQYRELIGSVLPANNNIMLKVEISSKSGGNPILHGLYIGSNLTDTVYITDSFSAKNNTYRELEIVSNAKTTLVKRDIFDSSDIEYMENYDPVVSYIAKENGAYIRLNLNDYSKINMISTSVGQIQEIEESGVIYYNISLSKGQEIKRVTIDGSKNEATYKTTLLDMINKELDKPFDLEKDRLYCSMLVKGVVVVQNSDNGAIKLLSLNSSLFYGTEGTRYTFYDIPANIGVIWGSGESTYGDSSTGSFDYISFYDEGSVIHTANNTYDLFINEVKNVPIAINFTNPSLYNKDMMYFYTVECNTANTDVRFYTNNDVNRPFHDLNTWSVGLSNLYIKNADDYHNESLYSISVLDYSNNYTLSEYINLEDTYELATNNTIVTEQYIVIPPKGMSVEYKTYDGTSATEKLLKQESFAVNNKMFKKLQYSNIDKILSITSDAGTPIQTEYTILQQEGILVWHEMPVVDNIYISYTIKKPVALVFDLDLLYELTGYTVSTYKKLNTYYLSDMNNGDTYDLRIFDDYNLSDLAYIECSEPSFEGQMLDEYTVRFNKHAQEKTVLVKTGYYYINGMEYYLFSEEDDMQLKNNKFTTYENIDVYDEYLYTHKATNNYVRNSEMLARTINDLYSYNCNIPLSSPKYNKYTACDSYNNWTTFNSTLYLTEELYLKRLLGEAEYEGFNDLALGIMPNEKDMINYAYIDITDYISDTTYLTLAATSSLKIFIGQEENVGGLELKTSLAIKPITEVMPIINTSIRSCRFNTKEDRRYYLIIQGSGVIDDIVMSDNLDQTVNYHIKNIEKMGFYFNETRVEGSIYKISFSDNKTIISNGASLCSDGYLRTVGDITWNATKIKTYNSMSDFLDPHCYKDVELIIYDYIKAPDFTSGRFITDYIEINPKIINRLFVKVNDVLVDTMDNFKISIYTTANKQQSLQKVVQSHSNYLFTYAHNLDRFVKVEIDIAENCVVDKIEIIAEYKTTEKYAPILNTPLSGNIVSQVYDSQQSLIYNIKNININDISNINDVEIYIRSMTEGNTSGVWSDWNKLKLTEKNGIPVYDSVRTNELSFKYTPVRYFQFKIELKSQNAYIDLDSIDIEVVE